MLFDLKSGFSLQFVDSTMLKIKGNQKLMRPVFAVLISLFQPNCDPMLRIAANVQKVISTIDFEDTGMDKIHSSFACEKEIRAMYLSKYS